MEISLQLLNKYVPIDDIEPIKLAQLITSVGLEVEGITPLARGNNLVVGYVKECTMHPDSDHLHVCIVEVEANVTTQIVCGAPNVAAGQKVIVALPGCDLGEGFVIKQSTIRGQESNGMICSLLELGIDGRFLNEAQKAGIEILDQDAPIGVEALSYLGLNDTILDIGLTPNRADCMSVVALAYEVAAILNRQVNLPLLNEFEEKTSDITVVNETDKCTFFGAKLIKGITTQESPQWLKTILMASGIKPVNNIVDIGNYVMLETGQPIHMYDYDKIVDKKFVVKTGMNVETTLLDEQDYQILENDVIIAVDQKVGCVAGVMGGNDSKIDDQTKNIVIEVATFDGAALRSTARRLNLLTDASQHYIKGALDTAKSHDVLKRTVNLLQELANVQEVYQTVATDLNISTTVVEITANKVNGLLGTNISNEEIEDVFTRLQFTHTIENDIFKVTIPTYRKDITMSADLVEEVARMIGYDNIPSILPTMSSTQGQYSDIQAKENIIKNTLVHLGLRETITYTLTSPSLVQDFNLFMDETNIELMSPLGKEHSVTRKSVLPSLLQVVNSNVAHNNKDVAIFEISNNFGSTEVKTLSIALSGLYQDIPWMQVKKPADFYVVKGFVDTLLKKLSIEESRYTFVRVENDNPYFHPGRSGYIKMGKEIVGVVGQVHPTMQKKYGVKETYVAELNLTTLLNLKTRALKFEQIPMYPSVTRDIALVMNESVASYDVVRTIQKASKRLVKKAVIFDVYQGQGVPENHKSVAIALTFNDPTKTLDEETINKTMEAILKTVEKEHQAVLRA